MDHCQYEEPDEVRSSCHVSSGSPDRCVAEIQQGTGRRAVRARYGVNVVPIVNPATVFPALSDAVNIPWNNASCANTPLTTIRSPRSNGNSRSPGSVETVSEQLDWDTWFDSAVVRSDNQRCQLGNGLRLFDAEMTLRDAVARCTTRQCAALSVVPSVYNDFDVVLVHLFAHFLAPLPPHTMHRVPYAPHSAHADRVLIGACNPM